MTVSDIAGFSNTQERFLANALQIVLAGLIVGGIVLGRFDIAVSGSLALAVTLMPALLKREFSYTLDPELLLWLTIAVILHTAGSLGLYRQLQWYDYITHAVSATVVAGIGYASFRALELHSDEIDVPPVFRSVFVVVFVLATGIFWEVLEFAAGDLITVYGIDDIVTDMIFNAVGATIVAIWGTGYVNGLTRFFRRRLRRA